MKTKKSIRKMTPLARKDAHLSRSLHGIQKRLDYLTEEISHIKVAPWNPETPGLSHGGDLSHGTRE